MVGLGFCGPPGVWEGRGKCGCAEGFRGDRDSDLTVAAGRRGNGLLQDATATGDL